MDEFRRLRILQVCSAEGLGGGELHVADLCRALVERGNSVHLARRRESAIGEILATEPVELHDVPLRNAADVASAIQLARLITNGKIDLIHAHVARDYPVCGLAARLSGAAFVLTRHHFRPFPKSRVYQWAITPARALIAVSQGVAQGMANAFPKLRDRIVVVPNWVDTNGLNTLSRENARSRLGLERDLTIAIVGQISPIKQQRILLEACARLSDSLLSNLNILMVGEPAAGQESYAEEIAGLIVEKRLTDIVKMTGFIPNFSTLLSAVDVVVVPSENEGFSLVVLEAMAAGVAVIASNVGGPAEIIEDGLTGILVTPGDIAVLKDAINKLLSDHELRLRLGQSAASVAHARFERKAVVDRIEEVYRGAI